jgi:hypothetical protein
MIAHRVDRLAVPVDFKGRVKRAENNLAPGVDRGNPLDQ